jgi:hypothetical protein
MGVTRWGERPMLERDDSTLGGSKAGESGVGAIALVRLDVLPTPSAPPAAVKPGRCHDVFRLPG